MVCFNRYTRWCGSHNLFNFLALASFPTLHRADILLSLSLSSLAPGALSSPGCDPLVLQFCLRRNRIREWTLSTPLAKVTARNVAQFEVSFERTV
jgi:hypothetical protein